MEGVGTSTAGFVGVTERGNIEGLPVFQILKENLEDIYHRLNFTIIDFYPMQLSNFL